MGTYLLRGYSDNPGDYRRRLERAKRARAAKRDKLHEALKKAGFVCRNGIWVAEEKVWP